MLEKATQFVNSHIYEAKTMVEMIEIASTKEGFIKINNTMNKINDILNIDKIYNNEEIDELKKELSEKTGQYLPISEIIKIMKGE
jgi:hypothetical protein